jgi:hypothetical protein
MRAATIANRYSQGKRNLGTTVQQLEIKKIKTTPVADRGWGLVTTLELHGGDKLGLYESQHLSPLT